MQTSLTLTLDSQLVEQAEAYARATGRSLSVLVEDSLKALTATRPAPLEISADILALMGAAKLTDDMTYEQARDEHLTGKYLK